MSHSTSTEDRNWRHATTLEQLNQLGKVRVRIDGIQIALFQTANGIYACDNQCPHEGYPLVEGTVNQDCVVTCNWHNWKFHLEDGSNLYGGDKLRVYPVDVRGNDIWLDLSEPPFSVQYNTIISNLKDAFDSVKGFWLNPVSRVLLVVVLANLGSTIEPEC